MIDSHCHLQDSRFISERDFFFTQSLQHFEKIHICATQKSDWQATLAIKNQYPEKIDLSLGIHPWFVDAQSPLDLNLLEELISENTHIHIGECGYDKFKAITNQNKDLQIEILEKHFILAQKYNRSISLHSVNADDIILPLLKKYPVRTLIHSFWGSPQQALAYQDFGAYLSFSASIFKKSPEKRDVFFKSIHPQLVLIESDSPDQHPHSHKEKPVINTPMTCLEIYTELEKYAISEQQIAQNYHNWLNT